MIANRWVTISGIVVLALAASGCASRKLEPLDYSEWKQSRPASILVMPPINNTPEVPANYSVLSHATQPLAEAGYYVMPVTLVAETFKENGMTQPADMHATPASKLREIYGADAALYITVKNYGTTYRLVNSESLVSVEANLVDLQTGKTLWTGAAQASSAENKNQQQGSLTLILITAVIQQIVESTADKSHEIAGVATARLLSAGRFNGLLFGPRSPHYAKE